MSHRAHKLNRKVFTEVKYENSFLIDFYGTGSLLATTAIDIQWPSNRMWLLAWSSYFYPGSYVNLSDCH